MEFAGGDSSWMLSPDFILAELKGIGIEVSTIAGGLQLQSSDPQLWAQGIEHDRKCLELAKTLGVRQVGEHYLPGGDTLTAKDQPVVEALKRLGPDIERTGVEIVLEPMSHGGAHVTVLQRHAVQVIQAAGVPGVKVVSDFNHMQIEGNDIGECLRRWGEYTGAVHLPGEKRIGPDSHLFDYRPGFRSLKTHGYSGWLSLECCWWSKEDRAEGPEACLTRALRYVKEQWNEA
jgi:sugar phosphate isomerase/epimerase